MKGRILKIKTGYNPNSSSIGVDMVVFVTGGAVVTVLFNAIAAILSSARAEKLLQPEDAQPLAMAASQRVQG